MGEEEGGGGGEEHHENGGQEAGAVGAGLVSGVGAASGGHGGWG